MDRRELETMLRGIGLFPLSSELEYEEKIYLKNTHITREKLELLLTREEFEGISVEGDSLVVLLKGKVSLPQKDLDCYTRIKIFPTNLSLSKVECKKKGRTVRLRECLECEEWNKFNSEN